MTDRLADYHVEHLTDRHDRSVFSSGSAPLDSYFRTRAKQDVLRRVTSCFVLVSPQQLIAGYYTVSATSILLTDLPNSLAKKLPRYPALPATLMGRLAVDHQHRGRGLGELLLFDAFSRVLRSEIASYAFVVDAKDRSAETFYEQYGFRRMSFSGIRFFLPIAEIASLFE